MPIILPCFVYTPDLIEEEKRLQVINEEAMLPLEDLEIRNVTFYEISFHYQSPESDKLTIVGSAGTAFTCCLSEKEVAKKIIEAKISGL